MYEIEHEGKKYEVKVSIEGREIPVSAVRVASQPGASAQADITVPPVKEASNIQPMSLVIIAYREKVLVNDENTNPWRILFTGNFQSSSFMKTASNRRIVLRCQDGFSYLMGRYVYQIVVTGPNQFTDLSIIEGGTDASAVNSMAKKTVTIKDTYGNVQRKGYPQVKLEETELDSEELIPPEDINFFGNVTQGDMGKPYKKHSKYLYWDSETKKRAYSFSSENVSKNADPIKDYSELCPRFVYQIDQLFSKLAPYYEGEIQINKYKGNFVVSDSLHSKVCSINDTIDGIAFDLNDFNDITIKNPRFECGLTIGIGDKKKYFKDKNYKLKNIHGGEINYDALKWGLGCRLLITKYVGFTEPPGRASETGSKINIDLDFSSEENKKRYIKAKNFIKQKLDSVNLVGSYSGGNQSSVSSKPILLNEYIDDNNYLRREYYVEYPDWKKARDDIFKEYIELLDLAIGSKEDKEWSTKAFSSMNIMDKSIAGLFRQAFTTLGDDADPASVVRWFVQQLLHRGFFDPYTRFEVFRNKILDQISGFTGDDFAKHFFDRQYIMKDVLQSLERFRTNIVPLSQVFSYIFQRVFYNYCPLPAASFKKGRLQSLLFIPQLYFNDPPKCNEIKENDYDRFAYDRHSLTEVTRLGGIIMPELEQWTGGTFSRIIGKNVIAPTSLFMKDGKYNKDTLSQLHEHELMTGILSDWVVLNDFTAQTALLGARSILDHVRNNYTAEALYETLRSLAKEGVLSSAIEKLPKDYLLQVVEAVLEECYLLGMDPSYPLAVIDKETSYKFYDRKTCIYGDDLKHRVDSTGLGIGQMSTWKDNIEDIDKGGVSGSAITELMVHLSKLFWWKILPPSREELKAKKGGDKKESYIYAHKFVEAFLVKMMCHPGVWDYAWNFGKFPLSGTEDIKDGVNLEKGAYRQHMLASDKFAARLIVDALKRKRDYSQFDTPLKWLRGYLGEDKEGYGKTAYEKAIAIQNRYHQKLKQVSADDVYAQEGAKIDQEGIESSLVRYLSKTVDYQYQIKRWSNRIGSISGPFNPKVVAGFPIKIEDRYDANTNVQTILGYVTSVVHDLNVDTQRANTMIQVNMLRTQEEHEGMNATSGDVVRPDGVEDEIYKQLGLQNRPNSIATYNEVYSLFYPPTAEEKSKSDYYSGNQTYEELVEYYFPKGFPTMGLDTISSVGKNLFCKKIARDSAELQYIMSQREEPIKELSYRLKNYQGISFSK